MEPVDGRNGRYMAPPAVEAEVRRLRDRLGEVITSSEPVTIDASMVRRFQEVYGFGDDEQDAAIPWTWLPLLAKRRPSVTVDQRPPAPLAVDLGSPVNGGIRILPSQPVRVGDTISMSEVLHDVEVKDGSAGRLVIVIIERRVLRGDEVCARYHATLVYRTNSTSSS